MTTKLTNPEAESALCGCVVLDPARTLDTTNGMRLTADSFGVSAFRAIWQAVEALVAGGRAVDPLTVRDWLREHNALDGVEQPLARVMDSAHTAAHAEYYAGIVQRCAARRALRDVAERLRIEAEMADDPEDARLEAESRLTGLALTANEPDAEAVWAEILADVSSAMEQGKPKEVGVPTGIEAIDSRLDGGMRRGGVYFLSGQKGRGKSSLKATIICNMLRAGHSIADVSLEMTRRQELEKLAGIYVNANITDIIRGKAAIPLSRFAGMTDMLGRLHLTCDVRNAAELRQYARRMTRKHGITLLALDYIQRLGGAAYSVSDSSEYDRITQASGAITALALELNIIVLAVSSESRAGELRGSGQLDYDGFGVWKLTAEQEFESLSWERNVDMYVDKNRFGPSHITIALRHNGKTGAFWGAG